MTGPSPAHLPRQLNIAQLVTHGTRIQEVTTQKMSTMYQSPELLMKLLFHGTLDLL